MGSLGDSMGWPQLVVLLQEQNHHSPIHLRSPDRLLGGELQHESIKGDLGWEEESGWFCPLGCRNLLATHTLSWAGSKYLNCSSQSCAGLVLVLALCLALGGGSAAPTHGSHPSLPARAACMAAVPALQGDRASPAEPSLAEVLSGSGFYSRRSDLHCLHI